MPRGRKNKNRSGTSTLPRNNAAKSSSPAQQTTTAVVAATVSSPKLADETDTLQVNISESLPEIHQISDVVDDQTDALNVAKAELERIQEKINTIEETLSSTQPTEEVSTKDATTSQSSGESGILERSPQSSPEKSPEKSNGSDNQQTLKRKRNRNKKKNRTGNEPINKDHENGPDSIDVIQSTVVQNTEERESSPKLTVSPATELNLENSNSNKGKKDKKAKNVEQEQHTKIETIDSTKKDNKQEIPASEENVTEELINVKSVETPNAKSVEVATLEAETMQNEPAGKIEELSKPNLESIKLLEASASAEAGVSTMAELIKIANSEGQTGSDSISQLKTEAVAESEEQVNIDAVVATIESEAKVPPLAPVEVQKGAKSKSAKPDAIKTDNVEHKSDPTHSTIIRIDEPKEKGAKHVKSAKKTKMDNQSEPKQAFEANMKAKEAKSSGTDDKKLAKDAENSKIVEPEITVAEPTGTTDQVTTTNRDTEPENKKIIQSLKNTGNLLTDNETNKKMQQESSAQQLSEKSERSVSHKEKPNQKQSNNDKKQSAEKKVVELTVEDTLSSKIEPNRRTSTSPEVKNSPTVEQSPTEGNQVKSLQNQIDDNIAKLLELSSKSKQTVPAQQNIAIETPMEQDFKPSAGQDVAADVKSDILSIEQNQKPVQQTDPKSEKIKKLSPKAEKKVSPPPKNAKESKSTDKKKEPSNESKSTVPQTTQSNQSSVQNLTVESMKIESDSKTAPSEPIELTPLKTAEADPKGGSPIILKEDETVKIWKILEEASKSLDPVEIEVDAECKSNEPNQSEQQQNSGLAATPSDSGNFSKQTEVAPQVLSSNDHVVKEQLLSLPKGGSDNVSAKSSKKNAQKTKPQQVAQKPTKNDSSIKVIETQPKRSVDDKKLQQSPPPTNKPKSVSQPIPPEEKPPFVDLSPAPDIEIPLDMSMISSANFESESSILELTDDFKDTENLAGEEEKENLTDSKNVQGSGFAQSVEVSANSTNSAESLESINSSTETNRKSVSPSVEKQNKNEINAQSKSQVSQKSQAATIRLMDILEPKMVQPDPFPREKPNKNNKKSDVKRAEAQTTFESKNASESKVVEKPGGIDISIDQATGKLSKSPSESPPNPRKSVKPAIPPKPEHLGKSKEANGNKMRSHQPPSLPSTDDEEDYIEYKFMPRQVFICTICQACKSPLQEKKEFICEACEMVRYCSAEHLSSNALAHKSLCLAIQEIAKKRGGHIYNNARILSHDDFRSLRVHTLNICENLLKRSLETYEREILLFPRICAKPTCREWRHKFLSDCKSCGQIFYCTSSPEHQPESHLQWCKAFGLYQKLVVRQNTSGRIEPPLPSKVMTKPYLLPPQIDDVFKDLYKNYSVIKDECVYATLTQLATAPLTAYYATQISGRMPEDVFTIHLVGAELQFEADILNVWETFFLHLSPKLVELNIVFCGPELNAENLPVEILSRIRMCRLCRLNCRIVKFDFQCGKLYHEYAKSSSFSKPDLICLYNAGLYRKTGFNGLDTWPETIRVALSMCCPIVVTSYTKFESPRDLERLQCEATIIENQRELNIVLSSNSNPFSSQRPERNFVSDEMAPMIFKNFYCFVVK